MDFNPLLSISIINYNTKKLLYNCLESVYVQCKDINLEVIVVDNNSTDGSQEMVQKQFPQVKLISNAINTGFGRANNQAIRESKGKYILLLNSDTVIINDIIHKMIDFMKANLQTGVVGCKLLKADMTVQPMTNLSFSIWVELIRFLKVKKIIFIIPGLAKCFAKYFSKFAGKHARSYFSSYLLQDKVQKVDYVSGACLLTRKDVIMDVGLFDEKFFLYYEDADLCLRIKQKGWEIILLPETGIVHYIGKSTDNDFCKAFDSRNLSMYYYYTKHHSFMEVLLLKTLILIVLSFRNLWFLLLFCFISKSKKKNMSDEFKSNLSFIKLTLQRHPSC